MIGRLVGLSLLLCIAASGAAGDKQPLKVLYAGNPGSDRAKEFVEFLEGQFEKVGVGQFSQFRPADAEGYDVVILDWSRIYEKATGLRLPPPPTLPATYDRPTILIGGAGARCGETLGLKLDWL